jgi:hypothetical protein
VTIEAAYLEMMPSTVTIYNETSSDKYGKPTFGTGTAVRCRIVPTKQSTRTGTGVDITEVGKVYCYGTPTVAVDDKLLLPTGETVFAVAVQIQNDESGAHHTVISIGSGR